MEATKQAFRRGVLALWRATGELRPYIPGDWNRTARREVLTAIRGEKVKASECGANAVREALLSSGGIAGLCPSAADSAFAELAATVILAEFPDLRCVVRGFRLLPEHGLSPAPIPWGNAVEFDGENTFPA